MVDHQTVGRVAVDSRGCIAAGAHWLLGLAAAAEEVLMAMRPRLRLEVMEQLGEAHQVPQVFPEGPTMVPVVEVEAVRSWLEVQAESLL